MFNCSMCKGEFDEPPAMVNGTGKYCTGCKAEINARSVKTRNEKRAPKVGNRVATERTCIWCGSTGPFHDSDKTHAVCKVCHSHRAWLLKCVRYSAKAAVYVERLEAKELPKRREREAQAAAEREAASLEAEAKAAAPDALVTGANLGLKPAPMREPMLDVGQIGRLARVEAMLEKLTAALGGV